MVQHLDVQDVPRLAVITEQVTRTRAGTGSAQNWMRVKREESILPENKYGWMPGIKSSSRHKRAVPEEWDHPPEKFWRIGEEDVTTRQDITATSGAPSSSASRGHSMDTES